ncbi:MAG: sulfite exporter TauE/SafE family protein [Aureliella sp.]
MHIAKVVLLALLGVTAAAYAAYWAFALTKRRQWLWPTPYQAIVGFITDFLDTLGIGSFAVTTSLYRPFRTVPDQLIPGTLNVGHTLPTVAQAFIFIVIVKVDILTLWLLIAASVAGAWLGAGIVTRLPRPAVQAGMGCALLVAAALMLLGMFDFFPTGGSALQLAGPKLAIAIGCNFLFGMLMTIGVGAYAPIMVTVSLLGMDPKAAFPIMMGSCAFLMPAASLRFIRSQRYDVPAALGLTLLGVPGVLIAAYLVKELPIAYLKWLVLAVVVYTATTMLLAAKAALAAENTASAERSTPQSIS